MNAMQLPAPPERVAELRRIRQYLELTALIVLLALGAAAGWSLGS